MTRTTPLAQAALLVACWIVAVGAQGTAPGPQTSREGELLSRVRKLTVEGRRVDVHYRDLDVVERDNWQFPQDSEWLQAVRKEARTNAEKVEALKQDDEMPLGYYRALRSMSEAMPRDMILVAEGASTMDISRTVINNYLPRTRLDAGSFGSMGLGHGFAIGAAVQNPGKHVLCLQGDGAFGLDRKSTRLNSSHIPLSRMPSSA